MDLLYGLEAGSDGGQGRLLEVRRAGALVRTLEQEDVPAARLSTGFLPSFADRVRLHFTLPLPESEGGAAGSE